MNSVSSRSIARPLRFFGIALLTHALTACAPEVDEAPTSDTAVDDETRGRIVAVAGPVADRLAGTLSGELMAAVQEGGPAHAIGFCANEALDLTGRVAAESGPGWEVKRTALRTRNPENAPDELEADALERFHTAETDGAGLQALVQRTPEGNYRYYRPLRIAPLCVQCHGRREAMQPAVVEALDARYPDDQATGYAEGELRGLIRITVPASAIAEG